MVGNSKPVLVVDDQKSVRDVIKDFLELFGYKVMVACDGEKGLKLFNSQRFDLVITDIRMPVMDGIELARAIRNSDRPATPIIAITAYFGDTGARRDLFNSIVSKPFNLSTLQKIVSQYVGP